MSFISSLTSSFTVFDIIVYLLSLFFIIRGGWTGFMRQLAAFFALVGSYLLAGQYSGLLSPSLAGFVENPKLLFLLSFFLLFILCALGFSLLGRLLQKVMQVALLGWFDRLLGAAMGIVKSVVITALLYMLLASGLSPDNVLLNGSVTAPYLKQAAEFFQVVIGDPRLREYLQANEATLPSIHQIPQMPQLPQGLIESPVKKPKHEAEEEPEASPAPPALLPQPEEGKSTE